MNTAIGIRRPLIVVGLGLGDEGKGATVDWLASEAPTSLVVRFNGGAQAAHNVVLDGAHHCFHQFGSATLGGVPTLLSRHALVDPAALQTEADQLAALGVPDPLELLRIDPDALIVTPVHVAANRTREDLRGAGRHGSCGLGIGETTWYDLAVRARTRAGQTFSGFWTPSDAEMAPLRVADCFTPGWLHRKLDALARFYAPLLAAGNHGHPPVEAMAAMLTRFANAIRVAEPGDIAAAAATGRVIFEGAQGVLLDEWRGFHPHTTWSTTTPRRARDLAAEAGLPDPYVLGVTRTYATRHGAGPLPTEDAALNAAIEEPHNKAGRYQGAWRAGHIDAVTLRYAIAAAGRVDGLMLTHVDALGDARLVADAYRVDGVLVPDIPVPDGQDVAVLERDVTSVVQRAEPVLAPLPTNADAAIARIEAATGTPVIATADGPARADRAWRAPDTVP